MTHDPREEPRAPGHVTIAAPAPGDSFTVYYSLNDHSDSICIECARDEQEAVDLAAQRVAGEHAGQLRVTLVARHARVTVTL